MRGRSRHLNNGSDVPGPKFTTIDEYLAAPPRTVQRTLNQVRRVIRKAMPDAEEAISYGIPAFKRHGRTILYLAGWKDHSRCR